MTHLVDFIACHVLLCILIKLNFKCKFVFSKTFFSNYLTLFNLTFILFFYFMIVYANESSVTYLVMIHIRVQKETRGKKVSWALLVHLELE